jgi:hypothetical protein
MCYINDRFVIVAPFVGGHFDRAQCKFHAELMLNTEKLAEKF